MVKPKICSFYYLKKHRDYVFFNYFLTLTNVKKIDLLLLMVIGGCCCWVLTGSNDSWKFSADSSVSAMTYKNLKNNFDILSYIFYIFIYSFFYLTVVLVGQLSAAKSGSRHLILALGFSDTGHKQAVDSGQTVYTNSL